MNIKRKIPAPIRKILWFAALVCVFAGVFIVSRFWDTRDYIALQKELIVIHTDSRPDAVTYGQMLDQYFENQSWTFERTGWDMHRVHYKITFKGTIPKKTHKIAKNWLKKAIIDGHIKPGWEDDAFVLADSMLIVLEEVMKENPPDASIQGEGWFQLPASTQTLVAECNQKYSFPWPISVKEEQTQKKKARDRLAQAIAGGIEKDIQEQRQALEKLEREWERVKNLTFEAGYQACTSQLNAAVDKIIDDFFWVTGSEVTLKWSITKDIIYNIGSYSAFHGGMKVKPENLLHERMFRVLARTTDTTTDKL